MNWKAIGTVGGVLIGLLPKIYSLIKPDKKKNIERIEIAGGLITPYLNRSEKMKEFFDGKKSYMTAVAILAGAALSYFLDWQIDPELAVAALTAFGIFIRQGIKKVEKKVSTE